MVGTEVQRSLDVNHRVAGQHASLQGIFNTLLDRGDVLARNHAALNGVNEFEALAGRLRLQLQHNVTGRGRPSA